MHYFIFDEVSPNSEAPFLELPDEIDLIESIMGKKPKFNELPIKIEAEIDEDETVVYSDILNPGVPLFSDKMKVALEACGVENIDYYPVEIIDEDSQELLAKYWLAVVKDIISCIDLDKSRFEEDKMGKTVITQFTIDTPKTEGLELFRFHNIPALIIINETLKDKLSEIAFTGVSFKPTDAYQRSV